LDLIYSFCTLNKSELTVPLIIDLDNTLISTDLLLESVLIFVGLYPLKIFLVPLWLVSGKAYLKSRLANLVEIDISCLPYNTKVISLIKDERENGPQIILATASHYTYAKQIAEYLGLFDRVIATDGITNLSEALG